MEAFKMSQIEAVQYPNLPLCDDLKGKSFFVRDCYEEYYDLIMKALADTREIITITGTQGIGKSIFYIYFFQRFKRENPNVTIVASAYRNQKLKQCVVYEPGKEAGTPLGKLPCPELVDAVYLYDGAPDSTTNKSKMITFTSPNPIWFDYIRKEDVQVKITYCMPFWDLEELRTANGLLKLNISDEELDSRFKVFGGSARICLANDAEEYKDMCSELEGKIASIKSEADLNSALNKSNVESMRYNIIFHQIPNISRRRFQLTLCSQYVADKILENISIWDVVKRGSFLSSERERSMAQCLRLNLTLRLYTSFVNQLFKSGTTLRIVSLNFMRNEFDLNISERSYIPYKSGTMTLIDGYCIMEKIMYLLITAVNNTNYSVNAKGIAKFVNENLRDFKERILAGSILLRFLFVIPDGLNNFISQAVDPIKEVSESDLVKCIEGIGRNYEEQLSIYNIHTVGQLRAQMSRDRSQFVHRIRKAWDD